MNLPQRISLLVRLGQYLLGQEASWLAAKERAEQQNGWFTQPFIDHAVQHIAQRWLTREVLEQWAAGGQVPLERNNPKKIGIVMAGNIPLVGFHDWLSVFISGHWALVKLSSKDAVLREATIRRDTFLIILESTHILFEKTERPRPY